MPRVVVEGRYVYETDLELEIGDEVLLPSGGQGAWVGRVTALSSDYGGPCKRIVRLVRTGEEAARRDAALAAAPVAGFRPGAIVEGTASCGHKVLLHVEEVNRTGRPTRVTYTCKTCGAVPCTAYLGSADAWRSYTAGLE
jgi:hypothetical protein